MTFETIKIQLLGIWWFNYYWLYFFNMCDDGIVIMFSKNLFLLDKNWNIYVKKTLKSYFKEFKSNIQLVSFGPLLKLLNMLSCYQSSFFPSLSYYKVLTIYSWNVGITYFANKRSRAKSVQTADTGIYSPPSSRDMGNARGITTLDDAI